MTKLEEQVLFNIVNSEYMNASDEGMIGWCVWSFSVTKDKKELAGALGSLVKKGYCFSQEDNNEHVCGLTKLGYDYVRENNI